MNRLIFLIATFVLSCSNENLPSNIKVDGQLSEIEFEVRDSMFHTFSTANGYFNANDSELEWLSSDTTLNICDCLIENNTLEIILGNSKILSGIYSTFQITKKQYVNQILESSDLHDLYIPTLSSELILNTIEFNSGDTLFGRFKSFGMSSKFNGTELESPKFEGEFRCIIREGSW